MKRPVLIISIFLFITASLTAIEVIFEKRGASLLGNNILILTLFDINLILIVVLLLLLSRNIIKFIFDRHQNMMGSRFRTKLILAFVGFSIIPSILLFIVASGLLTNSINNWFSIQVEKSLKNSFDVAQSFYENEKDDVQHLAEVLSSYITKSNLIHGSQKLSMTTFIEEKKKELNLNGIAAFNSEGKLISQSADKKLIKGGFIKTASELAQKGLKGEKATIVRSSGSGDIVIGIAPVYSPGSDTHNVTGVIVAGTYIKNSLVSKMEEITRSF